MIALLDAHSTQACVRKANAPDEAECRAGEEIIQGGVFVGSAIAAATSQLLLFLGLDESKVPVVDIEAEYQAWERGYESYKTGHGNE